MALVCSGSGRHSTRRSTFRKLLTLSAVGALVASALLAASPALAHVPQDRRPQTTEPGTLIPVIVTLTDSRLRLSKRVFERGTAAQFYVINRSRTVRTFRIGDEQTERIRPGRDGVVLVHFGARGRFSVFSVARGQRHAARISVF